MMQPGDRIPVRLSGRTQRLEVAKINPLTIWVRTLDGHIVKRHIRRHVAGTERLAAHAERLTGRAAAMAALPDDPRTDPGTASPTWPWVAALLAALSGLAGLAWLFFGG